MGMKIEAGTYKRGDLFHVDPFQIEVREEFRGRFKAPKPEDVIDRAISMMEHGQQQAVVARRIAGNRLQLVSGFTRTAAARLIREGFTDADGTERKNENFMLQLRVTDANDSEALILNIVENAQRNATSPIDDAHNHRRLREQCGMNDAEIVRLMGYKDITKVGRLRKLLSLPTEIQNLIHDEKMAVQAGLDLLDLPTEKMTEAVELSTKDNGKVGSSEVRDFVRSVQENVQTEEEQAEHGYFPTEPTIPTGVMNDDDKVPVETPPVVETSTKAKPRSMRDLRKWAQRHKDEDNGTADFASVLLGYMTGKRNEKSLDNALAKLMTVAK